MKSKLFKILGALIAATIVVAMFVAPVSANLSNVSVSVTSPYISTASEYKIYFNVNTAINPGDTITVTFPSDSIISNPTVTMGASSGWKGAIWTPGVLGTNLTGWAFNATARTMTYTLGGTDFVGASANVLLDITAGIINPSTANTYTLSIATSQETTAITSPAYTISNPVATPLPGVATVYNNAGIQMTQFGGNTAIGFAVAFVGTNAGWTITLTPGTYVDTGVSITPTTSLVIKATGDVAATIWQPATNAANTFGGTGLTIQGITFDVAKGGVFDVAGDAAVIQKCVFENSSTTTATSTLLNITAAAANTPVVIDTCTFNVTGVAATMGLSDIPLVAAPATLSNDTFNVDAGATAIQTNSTLTITNLTVAGTMGTGIVVSGGATTIDNSKLTNLDEAFNISAGGVTVTNSTINACGNASTPTPTFNITGTSGVYVSSDKITNGLYYVASVTANVNKVFFLYNDLSGSAKGFYNSTTTNQDCENNFWGAVVPSATGINTATYVIYTPVLTVAPGAGASGAVGNTSTTNYITNATAGVTVAIVGADKTTPDSAPLVGALAYGANPVPAIAAPTGMTLKLFFDVVVIPNATPSVDFAVVTLSGTKANPVTADSVMCAYSSTTGTWSPLTSSTPNPFANTISATIPVGTLPGTPIAIALQPSVPAGIVTADATPAQGAINVDPNNVNFTWDAVTASVTGTTSGATGYKFYLANADEQIGSDHFGVLTFRANTDINAVSTAVPLKYSSTYYWKVIPFNAAGDGAATVFMFSTMAQPVTTTTAPPVTITQTSVNIPQVTSTQITVTVPPAQTVQPVPSYLIWAVIAVGAILVIVVIVLIIRTRRVG